MNISCPAPETPRGSIMRSHGGGGRHMQELLQKYFYSAFDEKPETKLDAALLRASSGNLAFTTDSYVVRPLFFAGGDIGKLAVCGTINDLSMVGARPLALSAGFILEEGFLLADLQKIIQSMAIELHRAGIRLITGDTKVVERGRCDGMYINTSGIGNIEHSLRITPNAICPGDVIIINGDIGRHTVAVLEARGDFSIKTGVLSDVENLQHPVRALLEAGLSIHCLRDLTRGGLATALIELSIASGYAMTLDESQIQVTEGVEGVSSLLGLDPIHMACEGRFIAVLPQKEAARALQVLQEQSPVLKAKVIGVVEESGPAILRMRTALGVHRQIELLSGEQLPRIC